MVDTVFRTAQEPQEPKEVKPVEPKEVGEPIEESKAHSTTQGDEPSGMLSAYEYESGQPYSAEYFGLQELNNSEPETFNDELRAIDKFLSELVQSKKLENSTDAAEKYLKKLEKEAGIDPFENTTRRVVKLVSYLNYKRMMLDL